MYQIFSFARQMEVLVVAPGFTRGKRQVKKENSTELFERACVGSFLSAVLCEMKMFFKDTVHVAETLCLKKTNTVFFLEKKG